MIARNPSQTQARFPGGLYLENGAGEWAKSVGAGGQAAEVPNIAVFDDEDRRMDIRRYYHKIKTPLIHLGGWFDIHLQPTLDNFVHLQAESLPPARGNQKLIMTPSGHLGPVKGTKFPNDPGAPFVPPATVVSWFDHWLKGIDNGTTQQPAVHYYLMGDALNPGAPGNEWRDTDSWPPRATATSFYLQADGGLATRSHGPERKLSYLYDPENAVPSAGGNNLFMDSGPLDQRPVSHRPDVLRFVGQPLTAATEVVGQIKADLWVSTDAQDTDFIVKLLDIHPDGYEALVRDQGLRLRHYQGIETQTRIVPGRVYRITVDLWSTALMFDKGHRIGVLIQSSNWPRFQRHTNTWEPVKSYAEAVKATNTIHVGGSHESCVVLPVTRVYS
jgi:putative CocE/NonD family hydrolase